MAAGSALLVGLVEEFVSGQQDSKAADTATGISATFLSDLVFEMNVNERYRNRA